MDNTCVRVRAQCRYSTVHHLCYGKRIVQVQYRYNNCVTVSAQCRYSTGTTFVLRCAHSAGTVHGQHLCYITRTVQVQYRYNTCVTVRAQCRHSTWTTRVLRYAHSAGTVQYNTCVTLRAQCTQIRIPTPMPKVGTYLPTACRQVVIVGWRPIIGADCRWFAIIELTSEDAALLLIASENAHLKLKRERNGVHEINQQRGQYCEYHHHFPQLKADGERFFRYFRINNETFTYILEKTEHCLINNWFNLHQQKFFQKNAL
jgi:hypothetical protein